MFMDVINKIKLSDIAELITKGTTPTTLGYSFQSSGVNFLKIECFDDNGCYIKDKVAHISEECNDKLKRSQLKKGDILFSIAGAIGRVAIVTEEMLPANTNQALAIIRITNKDVYLPYIKLILTSPIIKKQFERKKQGVAQLNLSLKDIGDFEIPVIEKEKQVKLVELFTNVLNVIEARKQQLQQLDELVKARFVELFGDPIRNTQNRQTTEFINVVKMQRGFDLPLQDRQQDGNVPDFCSNGALDRHNVAKVCGGGVITGRSGTIGKVYYTEGDYWPLNTSLFSVDTHGNNIIYLAYLIQMYDLSRFTEGTGVPTLNRNKFHNKLIIDVPLNEQILFAEFVKEVDKSKFVEQNILEKKLYFIQCFYRNEVKM